MQFLDAIGLAYFWEKIKSWVGKNYLSLKGGNIEGSIQIDNDEDPGLRIIDGTSYSDQSLTISPTRINMSYTDEDSDGGHTVINDLDIQKGLITARSFTRIGGTSAQALIADGSVKGIGSANGIAGLDANGNVPLANLGNLDTTVAEVVTELPTSNIKRHIYLVKDSDTTNNKYAEYVYTGDISAAYDSTKWEKLGDFRATVDLADYAKKSEAIHEVILGIHENTINLGINYVNGDQKELILPAVTVDHCGLMSPSDKTKLNLLDTLKVKTNVDVSQLLTASGVFPISVTNDTDFLKVFFNTVAGNPISFTLSAAGDRAGVMTAADKTKLNGIATGATADSAITTAEIDALFA